MASSWMPPTALKPSPFSCVVQRATCNAWFFGIRLRCPFRSRSPHRDALRAGGGGGGGGGHQPIRVSVGDVELAVEVRGDGLPVLFVHGFPFDRTVWRHQLATLSRVRRIAPDLRGVGGSGTPSAADGYSLAR